MNNNEKTIEAYNHGVQEYIDGSSSEMSAPLKEWIDQLTDDLPPSSTVLELGSGNGREARYIRDKGFNVLASDAAEAFVGHMKNEGLNAEVVDVLKDEIPSGYDLVIAHALLLHFEPSEVGIILNKIRSSLRPGATFAFSVKQGEGEEWSSAKLNDPRYFHYWSEDRIAEILSRSGFTDFSIEAGIQTRNAVWIYTTCKIMD